MEKFLAVKKEYMNLGLKSIEILIISQIEEFERKNYQCYLTNEQFSTMFGESVSTIKRTLDRLDDLKIIKRDTSTITGNGRANRRRILSLNKRSKWKVQNKLTIDAMEGSNIDDGRFNNDEWKVRNEPIRNNLKENKKENLLGENDDAKKKNREVSDLSLKEKAEIYEHFKKRDMTYPQMYKQYNLKFACLNEDIIKGFEAEVRIAENKKIDEEKKLANQNALGYFKLSPSEGDELCSYLTKGTTWAEFGDSITDFISSYTDDLDMSAFELLTYFRENEYARRNVYDRNCGRGFDSRFIINQDYRWDNYGEYLCAYISNSKDVESKVIEYEGSIESKVIEYEESKKPNRKYNSLW